MRVVRKLKDLKDNGANLRKEIFDMSRKIKEEIDDVI